MSDFKPGDLVELVSGGPLMTVEGVVKGSEDSVDIFCVWFVRNSLTGKCKLSHGHFDPVTLQLGLDRNSKPTPMTQFAGRSNRTSHGLPYGFTANSDSTGMT